MNRNVENHFDTAPQVQIERSKWHMPQRVKTSFNVGELIPFFWSSVLPGDTWRVNTNKLMRMQTLKTPIMDDLYLDTYYFFVPNRLVWDHWQNFMGESPKAWRPTIEYTVPQIVAPSGGWNPGTVADYFGIPPKVEDLSVNALPFRAYAKIIEDWFRDINLQDAQVIDTGDSTVTGVNDDSILTNAALGGKPFKAAKLHDFFTSMLPEPQRGESVEIPIITGEMPVYTIGETNAYYAPQTDETKSDWADRLALSTYPVHNFSPAVNLSYSTHVGNIPPSLEVYYLNGTGNDYYGLEGKIKGFEEGKDDNNNGLISNYSGSVTKVTDEQPEGPFIGKTIGQVDSYFSQTLGSSAVTTFAPVNLVAGTEYTNFLNINALRTAFQIQRFYERSARSGNRYISILKGMFGVTSPDARLQRAEYLGGNRITMNIRQVIQTSETTATRPLGDLAAISVTGDTNYDFEKSFTEHGYLIGCMVARYKHSYQQGIEQEFLRKSLFDFYWPTFAHLGEFGYTNATIYATGTSADDEIFGYQEAWADYRYKPDRISGLMRTVSASALDTWHLADYYTEQPYLSSDWIQEDKSNVDRVLSVSSAVSDQIFGDIEIDSYVTRPMPLYSIPGLIDHF